MPLTRKRRRVSNVHTIALAHLRQEDNVKNELPDTPDGDGGTLGLGDAAGSAVLGTSTNNTDATEFAAFDFTIPPDYRDNQNLTIRLNCFIDTNARNAVSNLDVVAKLVKGGVLDATDLVLTSPIDIKAVVAAADQDFVVDGDAAGDLISAGDVLHILISILNDDTGGSNAGFFQMNKVSVIVPSWN